MKRVRQTLKNRVGLRMGNGVKDETRETVIHFVTTGYLVKLAACYPQNFHNHTHLVIDEVHERTVDSDMICMLAKRMLLIYPYLRLILMSATLDTQLYTEYFSDYSPLPPLSVGLRRFPLNIKYIEDLQREGEVNHAPKAYLRSLLTIAESRCNREVNFMSICLFVGLHVCPFVYQSICLSIYMCVNVCSCV